jgi:hypothetical protein
MTQSQKPDQELLKALKTAITAEEPLPILNPFSQGVSYQHI